MFTDSIHILLLNTGFREGGIAPILTLENFISFKSYAVDPLPQAMILTSIVIDIIVTALALTKIIFLYKHFKTLNSDKIRELRG
jgi:multicomponent Na+:H+ antiporter subunit C